MEPCLVAGCRAGFEPEAAADLGRAATVLGVALTVDASAGTAFVTGRLSELPSPRALAALADVRDVFARNRFVGCGPVDLRAAGSASRPDRVTPLAAAIDALDPALHGRAWCGLYVEHPDSNDGKTLSPLARALSPRLETALGARVRKDAPRRLHVFLRDRDTAFVGSSDAGSTPWPLGIPRIRVPHGAPSRSAAKLAEALVVFLGDEVAEVLRPGMRAVDLGAAPGGWTWLLAERGLRVIAVDNGPLKGSVADDPRVTHLRADGLSYRPRRPVDWLVCDIVEKPSRIARLVADWIAEGHARHAIFNLKLPMKKRDEEVARCAALVEARLADAGVAHDVVLRHLYHDREEVTGCLVRHDAGAARDAPRHSSGRSRPSRT